MTTQIWNVGLAKDFVMQNVLIVPHMGFLNIVQFKYYDLLQLSHWILVQVNCCFCVAKFVRQFIVQLDPLKTTAIIKCVTCNARNLTSTRNPKLIQFLEKQLMPTDSYIILMRDNVIDAIGSNPYVHQCFFSFDFC
jgi:hypothetical protein